MMASLQQCCRVSRGPQVASNCCMHASSAAAQARTCPWRRCQPLRSGDGVAADGDGVLELWGSGAACHVSLPLLQRLAVRGGADPLLRFLVWQR